MLLLQLSSTSCQTKCASDPLPTRLLTDTVDLLAPFISTLFNKSLASGMFPAIFKSAYITLRLKKARLDPADVKLYWPISNLPVLSKTTLRPNMRLCAKFHEDRSNRSGDIADFRFFKMASAILDLFYACWDHPRRVLGGLCDCANTTVQNLVAIFCTLSLKMPVHAPK